MNLYPLRRAGLDLLSTFILILTCVYRKWFIAGEGYKLVITSALDLHVAWVITMLSCNAECFVNVVLALAVAFFLSILFVFWIEIHKPLPFERQ